MGALYEVLKPFSAFAFLYYGLAVLITGAMASEFQRYGLPQFRRLVGALEVAGAVGLLAGYALPALVPLAAGGLALLMALGVAVRIRSGDSVGQALQALAMLAINLFVAVYAVGFAGR